MDMFSVTVSYHPNSSDPNDVPLIKFFLFWKEEHAEQCIQELRTPYYQHADEILKLYEQNENDYLLRTVRNSSTLDFMNGGDMIECETEEEIINEIIRFEFFNYDIKPIKFYQDNIMPLSEKISPFY